MRYRIGFFAVLILLLFSFVSIGFAQQDFPDDITLRSMAHGNGVRGGDLAEALGFERGIDKTRPLNQMGVSQKQLEEAMAGLGVDQIKGLPEPGKRQGQQGVHEEHELSTWKYPIFLLVSLFAAAYLLRWGKNSGSGYSSAVYIAVLIFSVLILGFALGKNPNPMEAMVKVFKAMAGLYDSVTAKLLFLFFFGFLAWIANKVVCGWACPFGALQELVYYLPFNKKSKAGYKALPWAKVQPGGAPNLIRIAFFVAFLAFLFGWVGNKHGYVLYHGLNPFNLFNFDLSMVSMWVIVFGALGLSLIYYRPFCRAICPFGLLSWLLEPLSFGKVRINHETCIDCKMCANACPSTAAEDRLSQKTLPADCFSCMRCLRCCPTGAIQYTTKKQGGSPTGSKMNNATK